MRRAALVAALALATLLRAYPLAAPHLGLELQEAYPRNAVLALVHGDWRPFALVHGSALLDVLRALYSAWYVLGTAAGVYHDRTDFLAAFIQTPLPFVIVGRVVLLLAALTAVWLAAGVATRLGGSAAGPAAAIVLATSFIHVRESVHVWPDGLAATGALATIAMALRALAEGTPATMLLLGALAGGALACKHAVFLLAIPVLLVAWWSGAGGWLQRSRRATSAGVAAACTYLLLSPHTLLHWQEMRLQLEIQSAGLLSSEGPRAALPFIQLLHLCVGVGPLAVALLGLSTSARRAPRATLLAASFPVLYLVFLASARNPFARYLAIAAPFIAVFAGVGTVAAAERAWPRRPTLVLVPLLALVCVGPGLQSWYHVRLLSRPDTRQLAGEWLQAHLPPAVSVSLPNLAVYPNPVLPPNEGRVRLDYPEQAGELLARGVGRSSAARQVHYLGFLDIYDPTWEPADPWIVTASHPAPARALSTPLAYDERLRAAGYVVAARFEATPQPPPPTLVYDPLEADYAPLRGAEHVLRPGPNLTIWRAPQ